MSEVVLGVHPSVQAASQAHKEAIGVSTTALYNKLDRVEPAGAAALGRDAARLAAPVVQALHASRPRWVPGSVTPGRDGHHVASPAQRLQELRGTWAAPRPGPALVVWDPQRLRLPDVLPIAEGHAQERRVMDQGLSRVCAGALWSAARHVGTRGLMVGMARRGTACLVRQHGQLQGLVRGAPRRTGVTRSGPVEAQARRVQDPARGDARPLRRMPLLLKDPTRDGDPERHLLSHVPGAAARAGKLAVVEGKRWRIATAFCESTTTRSGAMPTLGDPKAAWFALCLALVASQAGSVIKAA